MLKSRGLEKNPAGLQNKLNHKSSLIKKRIVINKYKLPQPYLQYPTSYPSAYPTHLIPISWFMDLWATIPDQKTPVLLCTASM
jgi:hypothetical protein